MLLLQMPLRIPKLFPPRGKELRPKGEAPEKVKPIMEGVQLQRRNIDGSTICVSNCVILLPNAIFLVH